MYRSTTIGWQICKDDSTDSLAKQKVTCSSTASTSDPASFPDVSLAAKGVSAQGMKGRGKDARRLEDFVFKMAECLMADDYAIFKKEHRPVCFTNFEGKVVFPHPVCQEEAVFLQLNGLQHHYRIRQ